MRWKSIDPAPSLHIVLGTGLAAAFEEEGTPAGWRFIEERPLSSLSEGVSATTPGHKGSLRYFRHERSGKVLCFQLGRLHGYEGWTPHEVVAPLISALLAGTPNFILTNAAGGLRSEYGTGTIMLIKDHVNLTGQNPLTGANPVGADGQSLGPRFPDLMDAYDPIWRTDLKNFFDSQGLLVREGVYLGLLGPNFETPAEVRLFASWGLDAVGMSTVWETIALRHAGARIAGISIISNPACGLTNEKLDHDRILKEMIHVGRRLIIILFEYAEREWQ